MWNYIIELKERFVLKKRKIYLLLRGEMCVSLLDKQLRKEYIILLKSSQTILVFFIEKKNSKKKIIQNYRYLNE